MDEMSLRRRVEMLEEEIRALNRRMQLLEPRSETIEEALVPHASEQVLVEEPAVKHVVLPPPLPQAEQTPMGERLQSAKSAVAETVVNLDVELPRVAEPAWEQPTPAQPHRVMPEKGNAELWMGQVWAVRIGVLLLFTGFVFLANYAWEHYISQLGAMPRLILLILLALGGVVTGEIMRRKPRLGTFGEVIAAGGLAALYYCAFAAHHIDRLRVIEQPWLGALLLTITGLTILGYGAWRRASVMCAIALLLSFYGTSIQPVVVTAMISGLIVSVAGAWLCVRYQWKSLGVAGLIGAYVAFSLWQGFLYESPAFSLGSWFLCTYWLLYQAVILHQRNPWEMKGSVVICSLNFGLLAAFLPFDWSRFAWDERCWMVYAALSLVALSTWLWLEKSRGRNLLSEAHLMLGISLLTLGIITKWSGHELFLILSVKGLALLSWDRFSKRTNIERCGFLLLLLSALFALFSANDGLAKWIWAVYSSLLFCAVCVSRKNDTITSDEAIQRQVSRWVISALSLIVLTSGVFRPLPDAQGALWMIGFSIALTVANRFSGKHFPAPEMVHLALAASVLTEIILCINGPNLPEWVLLSALVLALAHAVAHPQSIEKWMKPTGIEHQGILLSIGACLLMGCYGVMKMPLDVWTPLVAAGVLVSLHALARIAKWDILRGVAPLFSFAVMIMTSVTLFDDKLSLYTTYTLLLGYAAWLTLGSNEKKMSAAPLFCGAVGMTWLLFNENYGSIYLLLLPLALCFTPLRQARIWQIAMVLWSGVSFLCYLNEPNDHWLTYTVPVLWYAALAYRARVKGGSSQAWTKVIALLITVTLAAKLTDWVGMDGGAHKLTILWAVLAAFCFALGFIIREAVMRLMMLLLLLASMGNILVSVWQLGTLMRIASFLVTGMIFLLLGYVYNKHPEWFGKNNGKEPTRPNPPEENSLT